MQVGNQFRIGILDITIGELVQVEGIAIPQSPAFRADGIKGGRELRGGFGKSLSLLGIRFEAKPYRSVHDNMGIP